MTQIPRIETGCTFFSPLLRKRGSYIDELRECFIDEDERDEESENLLGERRDVADEKTSFCSHDHQDDEDEPETDPNPTRQVLEVVRLAELMKTWRQLPDRSCEQLTSVSAFTL